MNNITLDTMFSNTTDYPTAFMQKRNFKVFITIPHTDIQVGEALEVFKTYSQVSYIKIAQEHHEDGDTHIHMFISFKQQVKNLTIFKYLKQCLINKRILGTINIQTAKSTEAVIKYIDKEGNTVEHGERPQRIGKQETNNNRNIGAKEAIELAQQGNIEEATQILLEHQPMRMLENGEAILENLKKLNNTRKKFEIPTFNKDNTELKKWQTELLSYVNQTPKARRIIWVVGEPESGKSFMFNYLQSLENYQYGLYNAGQCVSMDNLVHGYDEEGIIAWDFPMGYDWQSMEQHTSNIIEKFSDFGQTVTSKKYKGKTPHIRGHAVVFSNREPLKGLGHRDLITIRATKEEIKQDNTTKNKYISNKIIRLQPDNNNNESHKIDIKPQHIQADKIEAKPDKIEEPNIDKFIREQTETIEKIKSLQLRLQTIQYYEMNIDEQTKIEKRIHELQEQKKKRKEDYDINNKKYKKQKRAEGDMNEAKRND